MTDSVTYADLRFGGIVLREGQHGGSTPEDHSEDWYDMYENVTDLHPPRHKRPPPAPAMGGGHQLMSGIRENSLHLFLISLLLCLLLLMTVICLTAKYVQVSSDLQQTVISHQAMISSMNENHINVDDHLKSVKKRLETTESELEETYRKMEMTEQNMEKVLLELENMTQNHIHLNSSLTQSVRRGEELLSSMSNDLAAIKAELEKAMQSKDDLNSSLLQCLQDEKTSTANRQKAEETLNDVTSKLDQCLAHKRSLCPEGWVFFEMKCLWISGNLAEWENSKFDCERKDSNLITIQTDNTALQRFLNEEYGGFWVGKELFWKSGSQEWKWPKPYQSLPNNRCLRIIDGKLQNILCTQYNRWICEKNLVITSLKKSPYGSAMKRPEFTLGNAEFYCNKKMN
ncbi:uncharacterized protein [Pyxicephalus adspersus]|uniref:uncharacterized protein n=1 Tax=Pyxicephalus adspersus TaxID=30357 RepID=UPI003B5C323F